MISLDTKSEVLRLRGLEHSYDKIASTTGVSKPKVIEICNEFTTEIEAIKTDQRSTITDELAYTTDERSKLYRELVGKVHSEILSRDITEVPTERLFTMLERLERSLTNLEPRPTYSASDDVFADMSDADLEKIIRASSTALVK